ncbi:MAG: pirin family protein [Burkholderiales bacterium]|nr:pirin family protein [Burkholderiales bacterium]
MPDLALFPPHIRSLDGFEVRRLLPARALRMVGPFIFFDHLGPSDLPPGAGVEVRPHPHIGLATVTYLFEGALMHRDSLGCAQRIVPGDVNWMTAGSGIVHSERTPEDLRANGSRLHAIQCWVALPDAEEETAPAFSHHPAATLPEIVLPGVTLRLIAGSAFGKQAPAPVHSPLFYLAAHLQPGASLVLPAEHAERGLYVVEGGVSVDGTAIPPLHLAVLPPGDEVTLSCHAEARLMLLGGAAVGERHIWWNFVSSSRERIEQARQRWRDQVFPPVPGETEFTPLPDR